MKFYPVTEEKGTGSAPDLEREYREAHSVGAVRVGETVLFVKARLKNYYIPYTDIRRCFRRVQLVPAKMCCGKGEFQIENLVLEGDAGELAQVQLPGTKAARLLMDELKVKMPGVSFSCPPKEPEAEQA